MSGRIVLQKYSIGRTSSGSSSLFLKFFSRTALYPSSLATVVMHISFSKSCSANTRSLHIVSLSLRKLCSAASVQVTINFLPSDNPPHLTSQYHIIQVDTDYFALNKITESFLPESLKPIRCVFNSHRHRKVLIKAKFTRKCDEFDQLLLHRNLMVRGISGLFRKICRSRPISCKFWQCSAASKRLPLLRH